MPLLFYDGEHNPIFDIFNKVGDELIAASQEQSNVSPYEEEPVDIETFINSKDFLNAGKHTWPVIQSDLKNIFSGGYQQAILLEGIGSGKSHTSAIALAYMVYRTLCLRNPQAFYQLSPDSNIAFMNMSTSASQARKIVFGRASSMIQNCKWFKDRGYLPNPNKTSELELPKGIYVLPGSSSETAPLGFDLLGAVIDEAAFMVDTKTSNKRSSELGEHNVAEEIFNNIVRRIESRYLNQGLLIVISSPRYKGDFISKKYEEAKVNKTIYARRRATFDCKPKSSYSGKRFVIDIEKKELMYDPTKELVQTDDSNKFYKNNPKWLTVPLEYLNSAKANLLKFLRDICAIASRTADPYILNYKVWEEKAQESTLVHPFIDATWKFEPWFKGNGRVGAVHVDLATGKVGNDACGIALACLDPKDKKKYQIPFMAQLRSLNGKEIDFGRVREIIVNLRSLGFRICKVTYDGWESLDSRQQLEKLGFEVEYLSLDRTMEPYDTYKEVVNADRVDQYAHPVLLEELEGLEIIEGKKVDHPPGGCFTGDMKVSLCDGRDLSFEDLLHEYLSGKVNYIYSICDGKLVSKKIKKVWETKKVNILYKITLDTNEVITCTMDHLFMLRDGTYKKANELHINESLMPLYRKYPHKGVLTDYRMCYDPIEEHWHFEHRQFATNGEGNLVHHIDFNKHNNNPDNLIRMSHSDHIKLHNRYQTEEEKRNRSIALKEYHKSMRDTEQYRKRNQKCSFSLLASTLCSKGKILLKRKHLIEKYFKVSYDDLSLKERISYGVKLSRILDPLIQSKITEAVKRNHKNGKYLKAYKALQECNSKKKGKSRTSLDRDAISKGILFAKTYKKNHKIMAIEVLSTINTPVYDLEVDGSDNFALAAGIFVHNSKDVADCAAGAVYTLVKNPPKSVDMWFG
jgi:hypothetical protein